MDTVDIKLISGKANILPVSRFTAILQKSRFLLAKKEETDIGKGANSVCCNTA